MSELQLFDSKGHFKMPTDADVAALDADKRARFETLRVAALTLEATEGALTAGNESVATNVRALALAREHLDRVRPKITAFDAWKQSVATQRLS